jgi:hypothetical protein
MVVRKHIQLFISTELFIPYFSANCTAIPVLFYMIPDTIVTSYCSHSPMIEIRVICHQPLCHKSLHLAIIFKFGFTTGNA